jgi:hypothetical protein
VSTKSPLILDPNKWPADKREHIRVQKDKQGRTVIIPDVFWDILPLIARRRPRVDIYEGWWIDLGEYHTDLKGWKLVGHGDHPDTALIPGELPGKSDKRLLGGLSIAEAEN